MELGVRQFRWHQQFHGIPWNQACANFDDTSSSMEFRGTRSAPISMTRAVPWNSVGLGVRQFRWHDQFYGIPWKLESVNFDQTSSSMEFHWTRSMPISLTRADPWNSVEFHEAWSAPISLTRAVPWNSMELGVRQFRWHEQFHGIPWISMQLGVHQYRWHEQFHGISWNLKCTNLADTISSMEFHGTWSAPI